MEKLNEDEVWRIVPPEEKLSLLAKANSAGFFAALLGVMVGWTVAVSLSLQWLVYVSLIFCPFIYQFAAGRTWRSARPRAMLEYLAARSAARRFAFDLRARDLNISILIRGHLEQTFSEDQAEAAIEAEVRQKRAADVWIGLFPDTVIFMSEQYGGAELELGLNLADKITVESSDKGGYSADKVITLTIPARGIIPEKKFLVTSRQPAALVVFEKKLLAAREETLKYAAKRGAANDIPTPVGAF